MNSDPARPGPRLRQLKMQFPASAALEPVILPPGYTLATLAERDLSEWVAVLHATGQLGAWDLARAERCLNDPRPVLPTGTYLVLHRDRAVATACTVLPAPAAPAAHAASAARAGPAAPTAHAAPGGTPRAELGWVAVHPAYRGRGLGLQVCRAVLCYARGCGWPAATLNTDDWRLPAIRIYLKLGFEPEMTHASHPARWREVHRLLASDPAVSAPAGQAGQGGKK